MPTGNINSARAIGHIRNFVEEIASRTRSDVAEAPGREFRLHTTRGNPQENDHFRLVGRPELFRQRVLARRINVVLKKNRF